MGFWRKTNKNNIYIISNYLRIKRPNLRSNLLNHQSSLSLSPLSTHVFKLVQKVSNVINIPIIKPSLITFDVTDRCQLRCLTCSKWKTPSEAQSRELETGDWRKILIDMKSWLGEFSFTFSGGEPLLRQDLLELCSFAKKQNIRPGVITNGYGFQSLARKIAKSGLEFVAVSLNGIKPETHDITRGVRGASLKTKQFINELNSARKTCKEIPLKLTINTILMPINYKEAAELVNWVQDIKIDGVHFQPMDPLGYFVSYQNHDTESPSRKGAGGKWYLQNLQETTNRDLKVTINQLIKMKKQGYPIVNTVDDLKRIETYYNNPLSVWNRCPLRTSSFNIDPYGYVRFCFNLDPIGNIQDVPPQQLFASKEARKVRQQMKQCRRPCHFAVC